VDAVVLAVDDVVAAEDVDVFVIGVEDDVDSHAVASMTARSADKGTLGWTSRAGVIRRSLKIGLLRQRCA